MTKVKANWEAIERDYRAGVRSLEMIGQEYGVTKGRISQVAKAKGWSRDLNAKIKAKAEEKVAQSVLNETLNADLNAQRKVAEDQVVEANAELIAQKLFGQRSDVTRYRGLINKLTDQLELQLDSPDLFERLAELMSEGAEDGAIDKLNEAYRKVISLPSKVDTAKKLAETLRILIELERKVLKLDSDSGSGGGNVEDFLAGIGAS